MHCTHTKTTARRPLRAAATALGAAGLLLLGTAAAAQAAPVITNDGGTLHYTGAPTDESVIVSFDDEPGKVRLTFDATPQVSAPGCEWTAGYGLYCDVAAFSAIRIDLGAGNDRADVWDGATLPVTVDGGAGNDLLNGGNGPETLIGEAGDDQLTGYAGDDVLDGGDGQDTLDGGDGADRLQGGNGSDKLTPDRIDTMNADVVDGGPGVDQIELYSTVESDFGLVDLSLDGAGPDGYPGEGDDIRGVEKVTVNAAGHIAGSENADQISVRTPPQSPVTIEGHGGDDVLQAFTADDTLDGGAGNDRLVGGFGNDTITGGPGRDVIIGDTDGAYCTEYSCTLPFGNDTIDARDGEADQISCGPGNDTVYADPIDTVGTDCETSVQGPRPGGGGQAGPAAGTLSQPGAAPAAPAAITAKTTKLRTALAKGLKLGLAGLPQGRTTVRAKRGRTVVASGHVKVSAGGTATVRLTFTRAARRSLAGRRKVTLTVSAAGRTATVTLTR